MPEFHARGQYPPAFRPGHTLQQTSVYLQMLRAANRIMSTWTRRRLLAFALAYVFFLGIADAATGFELSLSIFYLVPVAVSAWYAGRLAGLAMAAISASTWFLADMLAGHAYSSWVIAVWNALVRFGYFVITAHLLNLLHGRLDLERQLARTDSLSGALNRRAFREQLDYALALAARNGKPLTLAYLDLDDFKRINDTLGHAAGDETIRSVVRVLTEATRRIDIVARIGGDEFALLLPNTNLAGAKRLLHKAQTALDAASVHEQHPIRCSIGAVTFSKDMPDCDQALGAADALMYRVKSAGKNAIECRNYADPQPD